MTKEKELMTGELQKTVEALQQQLCSETGLLNEKSSELEHLRSHHTEQSTMLEHKLAKELGEENIKGTLQYFVTPCRVVVQNCFIQISFQPNYLYKEFHCWTSKVSAVYICIQPH